MLTYEQLEDAIIQTERPVIKAENFDNVFAFFTEVEKHFKKWLKTIQLTLGFSTKKSFSNELSELPQVYNYYYKPDDALLDLYLEPFIDDAYDTFPEAYQCRPSQDYCTVCKKPMRYCGDDSVMLTDDKWNDVLTFYNLHQYEREAEKRANDFYSKKNRWGHIKIQAPENCHTFVCNDCIERALGRPIKRSDINDSFFNQSYIKSHFTNGLDENVNPDNYPVFEGYFNDVDHSTVDVDDFTDSPVTFFSQKCLNPTHRICIALNTNFASNEVVDETNDYVRKIPMEVMNVLPYLTDICSNITSVGDFVFFSDMYNSEWNDLNDDVSNNKDYIMFNDENVKWMGKIKKTKPRYTNCKNIAFSISGKFNTLKSAVKFLKMFMKLKCKSSDGEIHKALKSIYVSTVNHSGDELETWMPNEEFDVISDDSINGMLSVLMPQKKWIDIIINSVYTNEKTADYLAHIVGMNKGNLSEPVYSDNVDIKSYPRIIVVDLFPINTEAFGYIGNEDSYHTPNDNSRPIANDKLKMLKAAIEWSQKQKSGYEFIGECGMWHLNGEHNSYCLLSETFDYMDYSYAVMMVNNPNDNWALKS